MIFKNTQCLAYKNKNSKSPCFRKTKSHPYLCGLHRNSKKIAVSLEEMERRDIENILVRKYHMKGEAIKILFEIRYNIAARKILRFYRRESKERERKMIDHLNENFRHYLLVGDDDWGLIDKRYRYKVSDTEWWDIRILLAYITQNLNFTNMGEPKPHFPSNPFTRDKYTQSQLRLIYQRSKYLKIRLDISVETFFNMKLKRAMKLQNLEDRNSKDPRNILSGLMIDRFRDTLRYHIVNSKDSQENYIGYWVDKDSSYSDFEHVYNEWNEKSPYVYNSMDILVPNPEKQFFKDILSHIPIEHWNVYDLYIF
jgi:hypothetical protein